MVRFRQEHVRPDEEIRTASRADGPRADHELLPPRPSRAILREGGESDSQVDAIAAREVAGIRAGSSQARHDGEGRTAAAAWPREARRFQGAAAKLRDNLTCSCAERVRTKG